MLRRRPNPINHLARGPPLASSAPPPSVAVQTTGCPSARPLPLTSRCPRVHLSLQTGVLRACQNLSALSVSLCVAVGDELLDTVVCSAPRLASLSVLLGPGGYNDCTSPALQRTGARRCAHSPPQPTPPPTHTHTHTHARKQTHTHHPGVHVPPQRRPPLPKSAFPRCQPMAAAITRIQHTALRLPCTPPRPGLTMSSNRINAPRAARLPRRRRCAAAAAFPSP